MPLHFHLEYGASQQGELVSALSICRVGVGSMCASHCVGGNVRCNWDRHCSSISIACIEESNLALTVSMQLLAHAKSNGTYVVHCTYNNMSCMHIIFLFSYTHVSSVIYFH